MMVIVEKDATQGSEEIQLLLSRWGIHDIRKFRIGRCNVLFIDDGCHELADKIRTDCPTVRVVSPMMGSVLGNRVHFPADTIVDVEFAAIGGGSFTVMAGPCAVEGRNELLASATAVRDGGAAVLRGGAYKPRTSPYSFQGTGREGIEMLAQVGRKVGLPVVSEVVDPRDVEHMAQHVELMQIGTRNAGQDKW